MLSAALRESSKQQMNTANLLGPLYGAPVQVCVYVIVNVPLLLLSSVLETGVVFNMSRQVHRFVSFVHCSLVVI